MNLANLIMINGKLTRKGGQGHVAVFRHKLGGRVGGWVQGIPLIVVKVHLRRTGAQLVQCGSVWFRDGHAHLQQQWGQQRCACVLPPEVQPLPGQPSRSRLLSVGPTHLPTCARKQAGEF